MELNLSGWFYNLLKKTGYCRLCHKHCAFKHGANRCSLLHKSIVNSRRSS